MKTIKIIDEEKVRFALETLKKSTYSNIVDYEFRKNILLFSVDICSAEIKSFEDKVYVLNNALDKFKNKKIFSIASFEKCISEAINDKKKSTLRTFSVLFFLNADKSLVERKRHFNILGNKIYPRTWKYIEKNFEINKFEMELKKHNTLNVKFPGKLNNFLIFEIKSNAIRPDEAFQKAYEVFEVFRGIINFSNNCLTFSKSFGPVNNRSPINSFLPSPFCPFFDSARRYINFKYTLEKHYYNNAKRTKLKSLNIFQDLLSYFKSPSSEKSINKLLEEVIINYGQSLDSLDWESDFLKLWRILELITFYSENTTIKQTVNKLKLLFGQANHFVNYSLDIVSYIRNLFVHKGFFPEEGFGQIQILKLIVEEALLRLFYHAKNFKSQLDLQIFYKHYSNGIGPLNKYIQELEREKKLISQFIIWKQKGKSKK